MIDKAQLEIVLDAATRRSHELLIQASKYAALATENERLMGTGQQAISDETMEEHYKPLHDAIEAMRASAREIEALARFHEAGWAIADDGDPYRPE